jgi:hypothetical protein
VGLISKITPGSIESVDDMVRALQLVIADTFSEVGSPEGRSGPTLFFAVDEHDVDVAITVEDRTEHHERRLAARRQAQPPKPEPEPEIEDRPRRCCAGRCRLGLDWRGMVDRLVGWFRESLEPTGSSPAEEPAEAGQPTPTACKVTRFKQDGGRVVTVIARSWDPSDLPHCKLCSRCTASSSGMCVVRAEGYIEDDRAALYRLPPAQPTPIGLQVLRSGQSTTISRQWRREDVPHCRLCPSCVATPIKGQPVEACLVMTPRPVPDEQAAMFRMPPR